MYRYSRRPGCAANCFNSPAFFRWGNTEGQLSHRCCSKADFTMFKLVQPIVDCSPIDSVWDIFIWQSLIVGVHGKGCRYIVVISCLRTFIPTLSSTNVLQRIHSDMEYWNYVTEIQRWKSLGSFCFKFMLMIRFSLSAGLQVKNRVRS
jgi:hypothetical protein